MIGLNASIIKLTPHQAAWQDLFAAEKERLLTAVAPYILDIQHIGSTAIPNISAKPIIDIGIAVKRYEESVICISPIEALGYVYRGENGIPRRHYFCKGHNPRTVHLHINEIDSVQWQNHILFRDYLRANPAVAQAYNRLKQTLAQKYRHERATYVEQKAPFIQNVLQRARQTTPTHKATCHCGAVELELNLPNGLDDLLRCNCSLCRRRGAVMAAVPLPHLQVTQGADKLTLYQFHTHTAKHYFCSICGIYTHHQRRSNPQQYGVNVACIEGSNPYPLGEIPTYDGINHAKDL